MKDENAVALGRKGGKGGRGAVKARSSEQAQAAVMARWAKVKPAEKNQKKLNARIARALRSRIKAALKANIKAGRTFDLIGCMPQQLREHLQGLFQSGMCWNNHGHGDGRWHVDHVRPCASFDLTQEAEQRKCFHYTNLQPLWSYHNWAKGSKLDYVPLGRTPGISYEGQPYIRFEE